MASNAHTCPVCGAGGVPMWWACCHSCHQRLPPQLARGIVLGWRHRVSDRVRFEEALVAILQWRERVNGGPSNG